jgi:hypothetical protein
MLELKVSVVEYSLASESGILQVNHHNINQQIFSNLRQPVMQLTSGRVR